MKEKQKNAFKVYTIVSGFIYEIIAILFLAIVGGYFLDKWLNTVFVFKLFFIIIGIFAGIKNLIDRVSKLEEKDGE